jgi:hypothetical protein
MTMLAAWTVPETLVTSVNRRSPAVSFDATTHHDTSPAGALEGVAGTTELVDVAHTVEHPCSPSSCAVDPLDELWLTPTPTIESRVHGPSCAEAWAEVAAVMA